MVLLHTACSYILTCECRHSHFWHDSQLAGLPKNFPKEGSGDGKGRTGGGGVRREEGRRGRGRGKRGRGEEGQERGKEN